MAEVGAKVGLTLKLFKDSSYEFIRPEVYIDKIDASGNVEEQLKSAIEALKTTWDTVTKQVNDLVLAEMPQVDAQMELQVNKKLKKMEEMIKDLEKQIAIKIKDA